MLKTLSYLLFFLGVAHVAYGLLNFRAPLAEIMSAGFFGQFGRSELRRTAFWFLIFGPLLMLSGHTAIHAVALGDLALLTLIGGYGTFISILGIAAFPKSPFWASLVVSALLLAAASGWI